MDIVIVENPISRKEALRIAREFYGDMVKGVVDVERCILALEFLYHADANQKLIEKGSEQENIWGFNIYPSRVDDSWIVYNSLINIRPQEGNRSLDVEHPVLRDKMKKIIERLVI